MAGTSGAGSAGEGDTTTEFSAPPEQRTASDDFAGTRQLSETDALLKGTDVADSDEASFTVLERRTCLNLLAGQDIGRVAFTIEGDAAPTVLPVNYVLTHDTIVFRSSLAGTIMRYARGHASFQVDHFDKERREGWSVLVTGRCRWVRDEDELARIPQGRLPRPWAAGDRDQVLKILPGRVSGRQISRP